MGKEGTKRGIDEGDEVGQCVKCSHRHSVFISPFGKLWVYISQLICVEQKQMDRRSRATASLIGWTNPGTEKGEVSTSSFLAPDGIAVNPILVHRGGHEDQGGSPMRLRCRHVVGKSGKVNLIGTA